MIIIREPQTCCVDFDGPGNADEIKWNEMHKIEFIIKSSESLVENKKKNETEQLLIKYNHRNNIYEHIN